MATNALHTAEQVASHYNLPSAHTVNLLRKKRKIPCFKIGYRTIRYDLAAVGVALSNLEVKSI